MTDRTLTTADAARLLGIARETVARQARRYAWFGKRIGRDWLFTADEIEHYRMKCSGRFGNPDFTRRT